MNPLFAQKEYESTKRINTLSFRSSYIPFPIDADFTFKHRIIDPRGSSMYLSLNGIWEFKEHRCFEDMVDVAERLDDTIEVPLSVQMKGYDYIQYTNMLYPFPFNPPYVPKENPLFHYRKRISLHLEDRYYLNFEGVDSAFYLYVNNRLVGYSQISHSRSEFDVTSFLVEGENVIDVLVLKWCASSYLEDQDKFRFSGIFRDVYLLHRRESHIRDYKIEPIHQGDKWFVQVKNLSSEDFNVAFKNAKYNVKIGETLQIPVKNPRLWSTESPYLYQLILDDGYEKIFERIGLREVYIKDGVFYINGKHIKLKGVNRHESSPFHGAAVTIEETIKDLKMIKGIHANAIRTSHYPDRYEFYELCDLYGIYVCDEADVECHGAHIPDGKTWDYPFWQSFADSGLYNEAVYDREVSLYERDKNRTCVIIFSLGNESCYGKMFHAGADYIHEHDCRPIHYEGLYNLYDKSDYYTTRVDICSRMYPSIEQIQTDYLDDPKEHRPLMICEYTHAMGNSCGDVAAYWKCIDQHDRIIGAFVWEWCDHAVYMDGKMLYGADFPEHYNDGNFCVDGLVTPLRKMKSSTREVASVYAGKRNPASPEPKKHAKLKKSTQNPLKLAVDTANASIKGLYLGKRNILRKPVELCYQRAWIDNDFPDHEMLEKIDHASLEKHCEMLDEQRFQFDYRFVYQGQELGKARILYEAVDEGLIADVSYEGFDEVRPLRLGLVLAIAKTPIFEFEGYGPDESYVDKCVHSEYGQFAIKVKDNLEDNLKPQESGSRYHVNYLRVGCLEVTADKPFSINVQPYSLQQLGTVKHNYELHEEGVTYVHLDVAMSGVGSHACGPELDEKYRLKPSDHNRFYIRLK